MSSGIRTQQFGLLRWLAALLFNGCGGLPYVCQLLCHSHCDYLLPTVMHQPAQYRCTCSAQDATVTSASRCWCVWPSTRLPWPAVACTHRELKLVALTPHQPSSITGWTTDLLSVYVYTCGPGVKAVSHMALNVPLLTSSMRHVMLVDID